MHLMTNASRLSIMFTDKICLSRADSNSTHVFDMSGKTVEHNQCLSA